jgi:hypothetical protein
MASKEKKLPRTPVEARKGRTVKSVSSHQDTDDDSLMADFSRRFKANPFVFVGTIIVLIIIFIRVDYTHKLLFYVFFTSLVVFLNLFSACMPPGYLTNTLSEV